jgi:hypothetical protein
VRNAVEENRRKMAFVYSLDPSKALWYGGVKQNNEAVEEGSYSIFCNLHLSLPISNICRICRRIE